MLDGGDLQDAKQAMRREARARRDRLVAAADAGVAKAAGDHLCAEVPLKAVQRISAYWPLGGEFDPRPLLHDFHRAGRVCLLPVVRASGKPLIFRRWEPDTELVMRDYGVLTPPPSAPAERPDLLLVPLLAFDGDGYRLGYGGGYYDRTLAALRSDGRQPPLAVGLAFAGQEVLRVPRGPGDEPLDWIVTEAEARPFGPRARALGTRA
ncbi:MAG: 5-formyltetrahydrofolate cyclo-ligase [Alphaproteobacteria bacterium]|jgi:5-formyltetrahydrofolate cyclo-ligase|nr:5-formyltetrahydrofolate cyclo-ligase [Alphaproteobacteria bacterium]